MPDGLPGVAVAFSLAFSLATEAALGVEVPPRAVWLRALLGELERRLNAAPEPAPPEPEAEFSSNGHGTLAHAMTVSGPGAEED